MTVIKKKTSMKNRIREFKHEQDVAAKISLSLAQSLAGLGDLLELKPEEKGKVLEHPAGRVISAIRTSLETTYHVKDVFRTMSEDDLREDLLTELSLMGMKPEATVTAASCEILYSVFATPEADCNSKEFREMAMAVLQRSMQNLVSAYQIEEEEHAQAVEALKQAFSEQNERTKEAVPETAAESENAGGTVEQVDSSNQ